MQVNYFGLVDMTKMLLPLLKRCRGSRIVNLSSMAGIVAGPGFSAYSASKHALEASVYINYYHLISFHLISDMRNTRRG
jgi:NAD(P)-dependent dehydrogenase (short-subunit alcohol dehydrogenase family)